MARASDEGLGRGSCLSRRAPLLERSRARRLLPLLQALVPVDAVVGGREVVDERGLQVAVLALLEAPVRLRLRQTMAISGHQWQTLAISGHQWQTMAISGHQWQTMAISGHQWQTMAISGHQWQPMSISGTPRHSEASG